LAVVGGALTPIGGTLVPVALGETMAAEGGTLIVIKRNSCSSCKRNIRRINWYLWTQKCQWQSRVKNI
jgi:hypothetical protein